MTRSLSAYDRIRQRMLTVDCTDPDACWLWPGATQHGGYGHVGGGRRGEGNVRVSRVLLEHKLGRKLKPGMEARHTCDTPACANDAHLVEGSHTQNMQDAVERDRNAKGERHGNAKLTEEQVRAIRSDDRVQRIVAEQYGIERSLVSMIRSRKRWAHVTD